VLQGVWGPPGQGFVYVVGASGAITGCSPTACLALGAAVTTQTLRGIWAAPSTPEDLWVVGDGPTLLRRKNATSAFEAQTLPALTFNLNAVHGAAANEIYLVGLAGELLKGDGATAWVRPAGRHLENLRGVWAVGSNDVLVVGDSSTVIRRVP
jgi:photosystem II stability/assembly factor-like uncharacterized protein